MKIKKISYSIAMRGLSEKAELTRHDNGSCTLIMYRSPGPITIDSELRLCLEDDELRMLVTELASKDVELLFNIAESLTLKSKSVNTGVRDASRKYLIFDTELKSFRYNWRGSLPRNWSDLKTFENIISHWVNKSDWDTSVPAKSERITTV